MIKCVTLEYCVQNLVDHSADPQEEKETNPKELLHMLRMNDSEDDKFKFTKEDYDQYPPKCFRKMLGLKVSQFTTL